MSFSFFGSKDSRSARTALVFNIGGGSVSGALVRYGAHAVPEILLALREEYLFLEDLRFDQFVASMIQALDQVVARIETESRKIVHHGAVRDVVIFYASPWYVAETRSIHDVTEKPFAISQAYLDGLVQEAVKQFYLSHKSDTRYDDLVIVEKSLIQVCLNGYVTQKPLQKWAREVDTALFLSGMSKDLHGRVVKILDRLYPHAQRHAYAMNHVLSATIRNLYADAPNFMVFSVGGEVTDLSVVRNNILRGTISLPFGEHTLIRKVSQNLRTIPAEVRTLLSVKSVPETGEKPDNNIPSTQDARTRASSSKIQTAVTNLSEEWNTMFEKALSHLGKEGPLPARLFMVTETTVGSWFSEFLKSLHPPANWPRRASIAPIFLDSTVLAPNFTASKKDDIDFFLILGSIFFEHEPH
jgi:hypothetical protein